MTKYHKYDNNTGMFRNNVTELVIILRGKYTKQMVSAFSRCFMPLVATLRLQLSLATVQDFSGDALINAKTCVTNLAQLIPSMYLRELCLGQKVDSHRINDETIKYSAETEIHQKPVPQNIISKNINTISVLITELMVSIN